VLACGSCESLPYGNLTAPATTKMCQWCKLGEGVVTVSSGVSGLVLIGVRVEEAGAVGTRETQAGGVL